MTHKALQAVAIQRDAINVLIGIRNNEPDAQKRSALQNEINALRSNIEDLAWEDINTRSTRIQTLIASLQGVISELNGRSSLNAYLGEITKVLEQASEA